jgi:hypothetical protein
MEPVAAAAAVLGGSNLATSDACIVVDRVYAADRSHGRCRIEACVPSPDAPLHLFDARMARMVAIYEAGLARPGMPAPAAGSTA